MGWDDIEYSGDGERGRRFRSSRNGAAGREGREGGERWWVAVVGGNGGRKGGQEREIEERTDGKIGKSMEEIMAYHGAGRRNS